MRWMVGGEWREIGKGGVEERGMVEVVVVVVVVVGKWVGGSILFCRVVGKWFTTLLVFISFFSFLFFSFFLLSLSFFFFFFFFSFFSSIFISFPPTEKRLPLYHSL